MDALFLLQVLLVILYITGELAHLELWQVFIPLIAWVLITLVRKIK